MRIQILSFFLAERKILFPPPRARHTFTRFPSNGRVDEKKKRKEGKHG